MPRRQPNDACKWTAVVREPGTSKVMDVDSNKDIDIGLQLPSPASAAYVLSSISSSSKRTD